MLAVIGLLDAQPELADIAPAKLIAEPERGLLDPVARLRAEDEVGPVAEILLAIDRRAQIDDVRSAIAPLLVARADRSEDLMPPRPFVERPRHAKLARGRREAIVLIGDDDAVRLAGRLDVGQQVDDLLIPAIDRFLIAMPISPLSWPS